MPEVRWSPAVERATFRLPAAARAELLRMIDRLRDFPEMGQPVTEGRFRGSRRLVIQPRWLLYYRVVGRGRTCVLTALRDARRRPV